MKKQSFYTISFIAFSFFLVLNGCKTNEGYTAKSNTIKIDSTLNSLESTKTFIQPYKESLDAEMNEVLVYSEKAMIKGTPESELGNFVADLSLKIITEKFPEANIDFCLLNNGGLRTSLPQGAITRGKIFELMPFDNELVIVTINRDALNMLVGYLYREGGQPISKGITLVEYIEMRSDVMDAKFLIKESKYRKNETFQILTTDYLAGGGDKMYFFLNPIKIENTQLKLRDAIIEHCIEEHKKGNKINAELDERIFIHKINK
ncbi:MAG: 5'-nucleotidase C-terminal domain-containing protein [Flavobacteriales bacterium]|nr:5'-nucleotidase C-terminal domain-containing protein [Flavobacteriales bacterium]MCB9173679.1 5'-nucleotidase C-terminal domain-containing protein [Flavobacteriales bacterium]